MARNKDKDNHIIHCYQKQELAYVSELYAAKNEVYLFLTGECSSGKINYSTHQEIYGLIKRKLGYSLPD